MLVGFMEIPWRICFESRPQATSRLYCLPFAGGAASGYRGWVEHLPGSVELRAVQPPGRHNRLREPPIEHWVTMVHALADGLAPELSEGPYTLFGHSLGGLLSFELARELRRRGERAPALVGVSAWPAPDLDMGWRRIGHLPDAEFVDAVRSYGGLPDQVLAEPDMLAFVLPSLRADFRVFESYEFCEDAPLDCPIVVFGSTEDPLAGPEELRAWASHTADLQAVHVYPGRHFYLLEHEHDVVTALADEIRSVCGGARRGTP